MRRVSMLAATAVLALAIPASALGAAVADPFVGTWTATDHDGSNLTLYISGSGTPGAHSIVYVDDAAGVCGGAPAIAVGNGFVYGDTLWGSLTVNCLPGGSLVRGRLGFSFTYQSGDDTLLDSDDTTWTRA